MIFCSAGHGGITEFRLARDPVHVHVALLYYEPDVLHGLARGCPPLDSLCSRDIGEPAGFGRADLLNMPSASAALPVADRNAPLATFRGQRTCLAPSRSTHLRIDRRAGAHGDTDAGGVHLRKVSKQAGCTSFISSPAIPTHRESTAARLHGRTGEGASAGHGSRRP